MKHLLFTFILSAWIFNYAHSQLPEMQQVVALPENPITLATLLAAVEDQTDFRFAYDPDLLTNSTLLHFDSRRVSIVSILQLLSSKLGLNTVQRDKTLILKKSSNGKSINVHGFIRDFQSGENLIQATAFETMSKTGVVSNNYGYYSITVPANENIVIVYSYAGYTPSVLHLSSQIDTLVNVGLQPVLLEQVTVYADSIEGVHEKVQISSMTVPIEQLRNVPSLLGETDVLKVLQLLPGIKQGTEGTSGMYVRGGGADQNLILLDGVPVYNASHLFGFFSVFNSSAINHVEVIKGGFPARYGGRLSSVVDISMKEGNQQKVKGEGAIGLIASHLTIQGPIKKGKSSFIVSGRRTYADLLLKPLMRKLANKTSYHFYDLNAKFNHIFSVKDRLYLSAYTGNDKYYNLSTTATSHNNKNYNEERDSGIQWGNITASLRWNHVFTPVLFSNTTIAFSRYKFNINNEYNGYDLIDNNQVVQKQFYNRYTSGIEDMTIRNDFEYMPSTQHHFRAGLYILGHKFSPGALTTKADNGPIPASYGEETTRALEAQLYAEDEISLGRLKTNLGIHYSQFHVLRKTYTSLQPRVSTRYLFNDRLSVKASYAQVAQFIHLLTNNGIGLPTDLWVPTTDSIKPQSSWQVTSGIAYKLNKGFELTLEGYYKEMNNIIEYKEGTSFIASNNGWEKKVEAGRGWSYGSEIFFQKKTGKVSGWAGYTLSWSERQFTEINFGKKFPFKYDRRHDLSIVTNWQVSKKFQLSGTFVYGTGMALTLPKASYVYVDNYNGSENLVDYYGGRNQYRMRAYHRMDLSATWSKKKRWGERAWIVSIYNVYNRLNAVSIHTSTLNYSGGSYYKFATWGQRYFSQTTLFPVIPSVSYQFKF